MSCRAMQTKRRNLETNRVRFAGRFHDLFDQDDLPGRFKRARDKRIQPKHRHNRSGREDR